MAEDRPGLLGGLKADIPPLAGSQRPHLCNGNKKNACYRRGIPENSLSSKMMEPPKEEEGTQRILFL